MVAKPIPRWLNRYLTAEELESISEAITKAELLTRGEVVAMIVRQSISVGHVFPLLSFVLFSFFLLVTHEPIWSRAVGQHGLVVNIALFFIALALARLLAKWPYLQRLCTPEADQWLASQRRAELEFYGEGLHKTSGASGVFIFISVLEHHVIVLADRGIAEKLPPSTWEEVTHEISQGMREKNLTTYLGKALAQCASILALHFPASVENPNELKDHVIIKD